LPIKRDIEYKLKIVELTVIVVILTRKIVISTINPKKITGIVPEELSLSLYNKYAISRELILKNIRENLKNLIKFFVVTRDLNEK
jgi:hypothetical protein